jgi:hypothetical protein
MRLTQVLRLDAVVSGLFGLLLLALGWAIDELLGVSVALTTAVGAFLVVWAAYVAALAWRRTISPGGVRVVAAVNVAWVLASIVFAVTADLTGIGIAFVIAQAVVVGLFAELQITGLRRTAVPA